MLDGAVTDTDIIIKVSAFNLHDELLAVLTPFGSPGALGLTHIIAKGQLARAKNVLNRAAATLSLNVLLTSLLQIEPSESEVAFAAEMEAAAQELGLFFDRGEAQLLSVVITRSLPLMVTGDKRAISAVNQVLAAVRSPGVFEKLVCLEQVLLAISANHSVAYLRARVCVEPNVDKAVTIAFSCGRTLYDPNAPIDGLRSYVNALSKPADGALCAWR